MTNPPSLHSRISPTSIALYLVAGLALLFLAYRIACDPEESQRYSHLIRQVLPVICVGMAAFALVKPLLIYHIQIEPDSVILRRMAGLQKIEIARKDMVAYTYEKGRAWGANVSYHTLTLYTSETKYTLDAHDYENFAQLKLMLVKGLERKY